MSYNKIIIDNSALSFEEILEHLHRFVMSKPEEDQAWKDFCAGAAGTTLVELIAGLGSYLAYQKMINRRESLLDHAQLLSQVIELAFNRGYCIPPSESLEFTLNIIATEDNQQVSVGQEVGIGSAFSMYSLEAKSLPKGEELTLNVVCGVKQVFSSIITGLKAFTTFKFKFPHTFAATQMEIFTVDGDIIPLENSLNYLKEYGNNFLLRRNLPQEVRIYISNNTRGWYDAAATNMEFEFLSYNSSTFDDLESLVLTIEADILSKEIKKYPVFGMEIEEIRHIAAYMPIDGRVVQDSDYKFSVLSYFGGVLLDAFSYFQDPVQKVLLLKDVTFKSEHVLEIEKMLEMKRAGGIAVELHEFNKEEGIEVVIDAQTKEENVYEGLEVDIQAFLEEKLFKFQMEEVSFDTLDLTLDLSAEFNIKFIPADMKVYTLPIEGFIKKFFLRLNQ